jgi:hypothetical protein
MQEREEPDLDQVRDALRAHDERERADEEQDEEREPTPEDESEE